MLDVTRNVVRLQSGYLYHYAFAMLIGVAALITWFMFAGSALMTSWPILSVITFLPLVGALFICLLRGDDEAGVRNARWMALWTTLITFVDLADPGLALRPDSAGFPVRRETALARRRHQLLDGRRRHFAAVRDPDDRADADLDPGELDGDPAAACANT